MQILALFKKEYYLCYIKVVKLTTKKASTMNITKLIKLLRSLSERDLKILKEEEMMCVTGTEIGVITLSIDGNTITCTCNGDFTPIFITEDEEEFHSEMAKIYSFDLA